MRNYKKREQGFTLVELAIVMIIIGLLIAGILKGQQMIENARITSTVSQIKAIDAAASTFSDMYSALPGDILLPATRLPNCAGACILAGGAGRGDGRVGVGNANLAAAHTIGTENQAFFTHLAVADLITGVSSNPAQDALGVSLPATEVGASGFGIGFSTTGAPNTLLGGGAMRSGHYLSIRPTTAALNNTQGAQSLTQSQAGRIDRKIDDGVATTGSVRAAGNAQCINGTAYQESLDLNDCNLFVRIQG